jgi:Holliday junction resolvasome RuvABC endonuclease subunit
MGVDPGVTTGVCVIRVESGKWWLTYRGQVEDVRDKYGLGHLYSELHALYRTDQLDIVAMEQLMAYVRNAQEKAEAQGVVKLFAGQASVVMSCYPPATIRALVVGSGKAKESDVRAVLRHVTGLTRCKKGQAFTPHQQDALAVALCCALKEDLLNVIEPQQPPTRQPRTEDK